MLCSSISSVCLRLEGVKIASISAKPVDIPATLASLFSSPPRIHRNKPMGSILTARPSRSE